ncbi:hypothetical protein MLD38_033572 [Melastoma candidum]|uniref:Uncharacterized protein n=1 Tax=Melastoma candidum TaxID=119954 RepID=A0ACB9M7B1_9MYRT|nr:hypothetical protein MLD38_033572 [Melastoma candidum]
MTDNREEGASDHPPHQQQQQQQPLPHISSSPPDSFDDEATEPLHPAVIIQGQPFLPLYVPKGTPISPSPLDPNRQFEAANPKRPRFGTGQWKLLTSPPHHQGQMKHASSTQMAGMSTESTPSPSTTHTSSHPALNPQTVSSSDTVSSPSHSPIQSHPEAVATSAKPESEARHHHQFRKGKYVSPVWKPNEMLWLARAWRLQYQGGSGGDSTEAPSGSDEAGFQPTRGKTRAEKDREVAEFLSHHGVNRDAKTAGTKWDNMLGEFRKVYEWERGGEREQLVGKSYFRLSPYERKLHRLPASFDEEVFDELSQFMGPRMRSSHRAAPSVAPSGDFEMASGGSIRALPPPPPFKDDDPVSAAAGRSRQQLAVITSGVEGFFPGTSRTGGGALGFSPGSDVGTASSAGGKELRRIGKVRMTWEESVSLWAEEGENQRGRIMVRGTSFLNADELAFLDESMVAGSMEAFEEGQLAGLSVDRFVAGQQVRVFGRRKMTSSSSQFSSTPSGAMIPQLEFQDPTEYFLGCLRVPPAALPNLLDLSRYVLEPPPAEFRFPLRKDVYRDLPPGKELFFTTSHDLLDCRSIASEILSSLVRPYPCLSYPTSRDSFVGLWDDCICRPVAKFCLAEVVLVRKPSYSYVYSSSKGLQDQWPNVTGFVRNFCLWRGEETDCSREGQPDSSESLTEKIMWTYADLPYLLGYYAVGSTVTFCALSRSQQDHRIVRTDLYTFDLQVPTERVRSLVPCYRIAGLLTLLAHRCLSSMDRDLIYSDFERVIGLGNGSVTEMTPSLVTRFFSDRRKWAAVKEIHDFLDHRVPHAEFLHESNESQLALVFKPRGCRYKPTKVEQLVEALMCVTKALVALHDLSFMHRRLGWDRVTRRVDGDGVDKGEWLVCGFEDAAGSPQIYPHGEGGSGGQAPEMGRGLHGVKVDVWGLGYLVKTSGMASGLPKTMRELQERCMEANPELRPTAADCYRVLSQLQSSLSSAAGRQQ